MQLRTCWCLVRSRSARSRMCMCLLARAPACYRRPRGCHCGPRPWGTYGAIRVPEVPTVAYAYAISISRENRNRSSASCGPDQVGAPVGFEPTPPPPGDCGFGCLWLSMPSVPSRASSVPSSICIDHPWFVDKVVDTGRARAGRPRGRGRAVTEPVEKAYLATLRGILAAGSAWATRSPTRWVRS
jgi:hypothetical protein